MYRAPPTDQFRLVASVRADHYQIPNGPDEQAAGIDDHQRERDGFANFSWLHTIGSGAFVTVSPFYHYIRAAFDGGSSDPIITTEHRSSRYVGVQTGVAVSRGEHNGRGGGCGLHWQDDVLLGLRSGAR